MENEAVISLYFEMLGRSIAGDKYNKAAMIRRVNGETYKAPNASYFDENQQAMLPTELTLLTRSKASIEFKLMNCTAAHHDLMSAGTIPDNTTTMDGFGYRAQFNYQQSLKEAMRIFVLAVNSLI